MMLSRMSIAETPGERPAPDSACIDVMSTRDTPNATSSGRSVMASPTVVQFGPGEMKPFHPRRFFCTSMSAAWSQLTPGRNTGTSGSYRNALAVEITGMSAAQRGSSSRATSASTAENTRHTYDDGSIQFACAIEEGIVLTIARGLDMVSNLEEAFAAVRARVGVPSLILGCDCILRLLEAQELGIQARIGEIMMANNVVGFATYGEQYNSMHVNQTFTGVAIGSGRASAAG